MIYMQGPAGDYNYGNAEQLTNPANEFGFYYAKEFADKSIGYERKTAIENAQYDCNELELIWYDPQWIGKKIEGLELDKYFRRSEVVAMRSDWSKDGMFAGFLSGYNAQYVSHLDTGSYVLDWAGTRWADDLGSDSLNTNYAGGEIRSYAERAEGHNTLVIDETPYLYSSDSSVLTTLVAHDFDDITAGTSATLNGNELGMGTQEVRETGTITVVNVPTTENNANNALQLINPDGQGKVAAQIDLDEPYPAKKVEISFRVRVDATNGNISWLPQVYDEGGNHRKPVQFTSDGKIQALDGDTNAYVDVQTYNTGEWYDISLKVDIENDTYDLTINGSPLVTGEYLGKDLSCVRFIRFQVANCTGTVLVDDIVVNISSDMVTLVEHGFDELAVGTSATLNGNELGMGTQEVRETGTITVVNVPTTENNANNALQLINPDGQGKVAAQIDLDEPYPAKKVEISFRVRVDATNGNISWLPQVYDEGGNHRKPVQFTSDGKIQALDGDTNAYVDVQTYNTGEWYDISLKVDIETDTYDLTVNGSPLVTGENLGKDLSCVRFIRFQVANCTGTVLVDDIVVNVSSEGTATAIARGDDQVLFSDCVITKYESKPYGSLAITDMTNAYEPWVTSAQRGVMLTNNRSVFVVRDEATLKTKSDVYWFAHYEIGTDGVTTKVSDDGKSAIMTDKNGNRMWVGIIDGEGTFERKDCDFLPGSPELSAADIAKTKDYSLTHEKLTIAYKGVTEVAVTVAYIPLSRDLSVVAPAELPNVGTLTNWSIPDVEVPSLDTLTLDGVEIAGFEPTKNNYTITVRADELLDDKLPTVAATKGGANLEVTQATLASPTASFTVTEGDVSVRVIINFIVRDVITATIQGYTITEDNISVNRIDQAENPPTAILDGDLQTRWASEGVGRWILLDFEQLRSFSKLDIAMFNTAKTARNYKFEIYVSEDGIEYTKVNENGYVYEAPARNEIEVEGEIIKQSACELQTFTFDQTFQARYIKLVLNGYKEPGETDNWNNIAEIR